jgi:hypothetical protein
MVFIVITLPDSNEISLHLMVFSGEWFVDNVIRIPAE